MEVTIADDQSAGRLTEATYVELVCSLFDTLPPTLIMGASFSLVGAALVAETSDMLLLALVILGVGAMFMRISVLLLYRADAASLSFDAIRAGHVERRFAFSYFAFAAVLGAFLARGLVLASPDARLLLIGLLFGYGAGVAAGVSLRPWISVPCATIAIVPSIVTCLMMPIPWLWATAILTALFLAGGIQSMLRRYRHTARRVSMERLLALVGRRDELTELPNQLALREDFEKVAGVPSPTALVAIHLISLDGIDAINRAYGYPAGDWLLKAAAERLDRHRGSADLIARLGGAGFALVQSGLDHPRQAEIMARELYDMIGRPFAAGNGNFELEIRIGYAVEPQRGADLESLMERASYAVDRGRKEGIAIARCNRSNWTSIAEQGWDRKAALRQARGPRPA